MKILDNDVLRITPDRFVWKKVSHSEARKLFEYGIFEVYELHDDGSESLIDTDEEFERCITEKAAIAIEVGKY